LLGDHNPRSGTDSDIAIAYTNIHNEPCLWLIEHKLTEKEFTQCGGAKSKNRMQASIAATNRSEIIQNKNLCYYTSIVNSSTGISPRSIKVFLRIMPVYHIALLLAVMNQLWRNQILGLALEANGTFKHVYFSVVHHPKTLH
jgi:hypothetical protein